MINVRRPKAIVHAASTTRRRASRSVESSRRWFAGERACTDARLARRWTLATFSLMEQLGNVGSEVERAIRAHEQRRHDRFQAALGRALELFDLTASDPRWGLHQRREILRAREQFCRIFFDETAEPDLAAYLSKYFLQFAVAARHAR